MKKAWWIVVMVCVSAAGAFAQNEEQGFGVISELIGDVQLKPAGVLEFTPARSGSEVAMNTIVSTGFKSTALIAVGSSVIVVRPLTCLSLAEIRTNTGDESLNVRLRSGRIRVEVTPPAGLRTSFVVESAIATASVRGTSFEFDTRNLKVQEGTVSFRGSGGVAIPVSAGSSSFAGYDGRAIDPVEISAELLVPASPEGTASSGVTASESFGGGDNFNTDIGY